MITSERSITRCDLCGKIEEHSRNEGEPPLRNKLFTNFGGETFCEDCVTLAKLELENIKLAQKAWDVKYAKLSIGVL